MHCNCEQSHEKVKSESTSHKQETTFLLTNPNQPQTAKLYHTIYHWLEKKDLFGRIRCSSDGGGDDGNIDVFLSLFLYDTRKLL